MDAIFSRASVRQFKDTPVEDEKAEKLMRAAMAAPSAGNQQPWQFILVTDEQLRKNLSGISKYAGPAAEAPLDIVLLADMGGLRFPQLWQQDMSAAAENILLEAVEQGLGGVWMGVAPDKDRMDAISQLFSLPENIYPFAIIAVGYPRTPVEKRDRFDPSRVHRDSF